MDWPTVDARIWQAIIAGAFVAVGWIVNGWQNRRDAAARRAERLRDSHRAIYAEIGANLFNLGSEKALMANADAVRQRMTEDASFVPFVPTERRSPVFDAMREHIHILPRVTIDPIVAYYAQVGAVAALADDMRGVRFRTLSPDRRTAIYDDYIGMKVQALSFGDFALRMIAAYAEGGKDAAEALSRRINSSDADPSDP